jgi:hypothetical protein
MFRFVTGATGVWGARAWVVRGLIRHSTTSAAREARRL